MFRQEYCNTFVKCIGACARISIEENSYSNKGLDLEENTMPIIQDYDIAKMIQYPLKAWKLNSVVDDNLYFTSPTYGNIVDHPSGSTYYISGYIFNGTYKLTIPCL